MQVPRWPVAVVGAAVAISFLPLCASQGVELTPGVYTDSKTEIQFSTWSQEPDEVGNGGFVFGMVLPEDAGTKNATEYIGMLRCQITDADHTGWCGVAHKGGMLRDLLLMAWPFGENVLLSFRWAEDYFPPDLFLGTAKVSQISSWVNETMYEVLFRCEGCFSWTADDGSIETVSTAPGPLFMGHAQSHDTPGNAGCPDDISIQFHDNGFGTFPADITNTSSPDYTKWAALATQTLPDTCTTQTST